MNDQDNGMSFAETLVMVIIVSLLTLAGIACIVGYVMWDVP